MGVFKRSFCLYPKTLIVVVARGNFKGELLNTLSSFPEYLDLCDVGPDPSEEDPVEQSSKYSLTGFITWDPIFSDYTVHMKNKKREDKKVDWFLYNIRGTRTMSDETFRSNNVCFDAQILMFTQHGQD